MKPADYERVLHETLAELPPPVRESIRNVEFVFVDVPSRDQMKKMKMCDDCELLGLYEGVSLADRSPSEPPMFPDRITIFRKAHEQGFDPGEIEEAVRETILHELGHYLGWDDEKLEELGL